MKYVCQVCGYVYEGDNPPEKCPQCGAPAEKFKAQEGEMTWAAEHVVGVAKGVSEDILNDLRANFNGECSEVGMYLAMSRVAMREGYPEIGMYYRQAAFEACAFVMDYLKTRAPFWKKEQTAAGPRWVEGRASDDAAADRWQ